MIARLIWRNLWRNPKRSFITIASIAFAILFSVLMQSMQNGIFNNLIKNVVGYFTGYAQIHQKGYWEERIVNNCFDLNDSLISQITKYPSITHMAPRLESFVLAANKNNSKGCMLIGTDPVREDALTQLKRKLIQGSYFNNNEQSALIAEGLASRLSLGLNDTIVLFGQGFRDVMAAGKYKIKGILRLASPQMNDAFIYLPLSTAQSFLSAENKLTSISLGIDHPENLKAITKNLQMNIGDNYEAMSWQEMMPDISSHIKGDKITFFVFSGILYLIIGFGIFGTLLMMTVERKYEFGMLVAIGMKKTMLKIMLLGESILLTFFGVLLGVLLSFPIVFYLKRNPIRLGGEIARAYEKFGFEAIFPAATDPSIFIQQSLIVMVMALCIGLYPLWNVSRLNPVKAMKK